MPLLPSSSVKAPSADETLTPEERWRWDLVAGAVALVVIILDQITKALVVGHFSGPHRYDNVPVIGNLVDFEYLQNTGAAFSSFEQSPVLLGFLILVACGVIAWLYWSMRPRANPWLRITFGMIAGGAVGNLLDRLRLGYVVDFIHFQIPAIHYSFAVFNVADSGIVVGVFALAIIFWLLPREAEQTAADRNKLADADAPQPKPVLPAKSTRGGMVNGMQPPAKQPLPASAKLPAVKAKATVAQSAARPAQVASARPSSKKRKRK